MKHTHAHGHVRNHPHARGHKVTVYHVHEHGHAVDHAPSRDERWPVEHRRHLHSGADEAILTRQQRAR